MVTSLIHTDSGIGRLYDGEGMYWDLLEVPWTSGHLQSESQSEIVFSVLAMALSLIRLYW